MLRRLRDLMPPIGRNRTCKLRLSCRLLIGIASGKALLRRPNRLAPLLKGLFVFERLSA